MNQTTSPTLVPTGDFEPVSQQWDGSARGPVRFAREPDDLPERLAHVALRVVDDIARALSHSFVRPLDHVSPDVVDPDHPGAPSTWSDAFATRRIVRYVGEIPGFSPVFLGEEFGLTTMAYEEDDCVLVVDSVDGTSVLEELHGMGAVVLVAARRVRHGWERIGGAIGLLDATRSVIYWNGAGHVSHMRYEGSEIRIGALREIREGRDDAWAMVGAGRDRLPDYLAYVEALGAKRAHTVGGNPLLGALLAGQIGCLIEPVPQRPYDAAYLLPALYRGCRGIWLETGDDISVAEVWMGFEAYLRDPGSRPRSVAPFALFSNATMLREMVVMRKSALRG